MSYNPITAQINDVCDVYDIGGYCQNDAVCEEKDGEPVCKYGYNFILLKLDKKYIIINFRNRTL